MFVVPLVAGLWLLLIAAGVIVGGVASSALNVALFLAGSVLIVAGIRMAKGNASALRLARRSAAFALAVAMFPVVLVVLDFAFTRDVERLTLASGVLRLGVAGAVPALAVLLTCRARQAN